MNAASAEALALGVPGKTLTYGGGPDADAPLDVERVGPDRALGTLRVEGRALTLDVPQPGLHNLENALATVAVGLELGLTFDRIAAGLADFRGVERRFEVRGEPGGVLIVDDYGHHPTEIAAVMASAKLLRRPVVVAFQPHRYTRTARLMDAFGPSFAGADRIILTDIYAAIQLATSNAYYGAWALSTGAAELPVAACGSRISASEAYDLAGKDCIQMHGGVGFTWEYDCHLFYRRSKLLSLSLGAPGEWRNRLIDRLEA